MTASTLLDRSMAPLAEEVPAAASERLATERGAIERGATEGGPDRPGEPASSPRAGRWAALALAAAACAAAIAGMGLPEAGTGAEAPPAFAERRPPDASAAGAFLASPPFDSLRRAIVGIDPLPVAAVPPAPPQPTEAPALAGVLAGNGEGRVLFVGATRWQGLGSEHLGWRVERIGPDTVTLVRSGETLLLHTRDGLR